MQFTLTEACQVLHPRITERRLRAIIAQLPAFTPAGSRQTGKPGHPRAVYEWADLARLHAAITPWLGVSDDSETAG